MMSQRSYGRLPHPLVEQIARDVDDLVERDGGPRGDHSDHHRQHDQERVLPETPAAATRG